MKFLILITIAIASLNVFSNELGENQKSECPYANQTSSRDAKDLKDVKASEAEAPLAEVRTISK